MVPNFLENDSYLLKIELKNKFLGTVIILIFPVLIELSLEFLG